MKATYHSILPVVLSSVWMKSPFVISTDAVPECGDVGNLNKRKDNGIFLVRKCFSDNWSLRAVAGGNTALITGTLVADKANGVRHSKKSPLLEKEDDELNPPNFTLAVGKRDVDGFDFALKKGGACMSINSPDDTPIFIGKNRVKLSTKSFRLPSFKPCDGPILEYTFDHFVPGIAEEKYQSEIDSEGWTLCYSGIYSDALNEVDDQIVAACGGGDYVMYGCRPETSSDSWTLVGFGNTNLAFTNTGKGNNNKVTKDGAIQWYFNDAWSMGFSPAGSSVRKMSCDTNLKVANNKRLCWHTKGNSGGWRCGSTIDLNSNKNYQRAVWTKDALVKGKGMGLYTDSGEFEWDATRGYGDPQSNSVGFSKSAGHFDGKDDHMLVQQAKNLNMDEYSMMAWARYTPVITNKNATAEYRNHHIFQKAGAFWMVIQEETGIVRAGGYFGGCKSDNIFSIDSTRQIPAHTWTHLVVTKSRNELKIYINGELSGESTIPTSEGFCANQAPLNIGSRYRETRAASDGYFNGYLDSVRVYDRGLSQDEIRSEMFRNR